MRRGLVFLDKHMSSPGRDIKHLKVPFGTCRVSGGSREEKRKEQPWSGAQSTAQLCLQERASSSNRWAGPGDTGLNLFVTGGTGSPWALLFQEEKRHQLQIDLPLPSWDQFNIYSRAAPSRIYQQFRQKDVSCVPHHTQTRAQVFLTTFPNQSSATLLDWNSVTALSDGHVCSESKKLFPKKSILSFNFNYLPVQIIGN